MKTSTRGAAFIAREEGCVLHPYNDAVDHATIGVGHLLHYGPVTAHDLAQYRSFDRAAALALLEKDLARFERAVNLAVRVPLRQWEFDALVSFAFNIGEAGMATSSAVASLNAGHRADVPAGLMHWSYAGGAPILAGRRQREGTLFAKGDYGAGIGAVVKRVVKKVIRRVAPLRTRAV